MAVVSSTYWNPSSLRNPSFNFSTTQRRNRSTTRFPSIKTFNFSTTQRRNRSTTRFPSIKTRSSSRRSFEIVNCTEKDDEVKDVGVKAALSMLKFYKREISPLMPNSCRYVPTCSEYSMEAYKKYGVAKGTILTAWRLCRCNPLGGSGFDPPRWFNEGDPPEQ